MFPTRSRPIIFTEVVLVIEVTPNEGTPGQPPLLQVPPRLLTGLQIELQGTEGLRAVLGASPASSCQRLTGEFHGSPMTACSLCRNQGFGEPETITHIHSNASFGSDESQRERLIVQLLPAALRPFSHLVTGPPLQGRFTRQSCQLDPAELASTLSGPSATPGCHG
ncbi:hypothetical protein DPEC_G00150010 [Dallia pectoralis]|uniref:Uncharacterized protein n=1 Tax=Dallia pectoralis TaxID=75939 RepID=A0ACC2GIP4_DALPE|nr:hypothetical protein DPEC_G00150010 [Dallia pectoralis]